MCVCVFVILHAYCTVCARETEGRRERRITNQAMKVKRRQQRMQCRPCLVLPFVKPNSCSFKDIGGISAPCNFCVIYLLIQIYVERHKIKILFVSLRFHE
jgi:hypothetical protein